MSSGHWRLRPLAQDFRAAVAGQPAIALYHPEPGRLRPRTLFRMMSATKKSLAPFRRSSCHRAASPSVRSCFFCSAQLIACGNAGDDAPASEQEASDAFDCNEARGALVTLQQMIAGQERIDASGLGQSQASLRRLAEEKNAPVEIRRDLDIWREAVLAHGHSLTSWKPTFVDGRYAEPDTTAIDRQMLDIVVGVRRRIDDWVAQECGRL